MELPEVRNSESPRDLLKDLGDHYLASEKRSRNVIYGNLLREGVRVKFIKTFMTFMFNVIVHFQVHDAVIAYFQVHFTIII